jgi:hypothetical protein
MKGEQETIYKIRAGRKGEWGWKSNCLGLSSGSKKSWLKRQLKNARLISWLEPLKAADQSQKSQLIRARKVSWPDPEKSPDQSQKSQLIRAGKVSWPDPEKSADQSQKSQLTRARKVSWTKPEKSAEQSKKSQLTFAKNWIFENQIFSVRASFSLLFKILKKQ